MRARFGAWYELFPRSWGGFAGVRKLLPELRRARLRRRSTCRRSTRSAHTNRKGRNNTLTAGPGDPGSPWAIGSTEGGHDAVNPELGTLEEFERLVADAEEHGIEIAIDFAVQCSPDHPWLKEHPEWFNRRPDGTLKYAENPPKKYQDIYNVNFDSEDWRALWDALPRRRPHLGRARRHRLPRRQPAHEAAALLGVADRRGAPRPSGSDLPRRGVHAARDDDRAREGGLRAELHVLHVEEHALGAARVHGPAARLVARSSGRTVFANTPDILHEYLQRGGPAAFEARLVLAATLSPCYGIYSGFESFENVPVREGSEEYLDSEKYELKRRASTGRCCRSSRRSTGRDGRTPRCSGSTT